LLDAYVLKNKVKPVINTLNRDEIYLLVTESTLTNDEQAIVFCLYLTGARASELLMIRANDFERKPVPNSNDSELVVTINTLKNRREKLRAIVIPLKHEIEKEMWVLVRKHLEERVLETQQQDCLLFEMTRRQVHLITTKLKIPVTVRDGHKRNNLVFATNPHYYRHCRATHLVNDYHFDVIELMRFMGWSNTNPAVIYVRKDWVNQAQRFSAVKDDYDKALEKDATLNSQPSNDNNDNETINSTKNNSKIV
jgi:site-specific recombinase XerD